jgi:lysophospholipase L1-like esterase
MAKVIKLVLLISLIFFCDFNNRITVFLIGDSTMSDKPNPIENPERGWGQTLPQFFNKNVTIKNFAVNGRSTKSFIDEGRWDSVVSEIKKGDYVFIQFAHNDQKFKDSLRYTNPLTGYRNNLAKFVNETRERGGIPVLFSPVVRRNFNEFGVLVDTHGLYPLIMRQVALELQVPFVDLQLKSENLVLSVGQEKSKDLYLWIEPGQYTMYPDGKQDNTHFSVKGATEISKLAIEGLKENGLGITKFLKYKK